MEFTVQNRVNEHALYVDSHVDNHVRFFTALQGSQNYNLHDSYSDVDTKSLMVPTFESLVHARKRVSHTLEVAPTVEHADVKDAREMFHTFLKQNVNFLEILFTPYVNVNPEFEQHHYELVRMKEEIAHYNPYQALRTMCGMAFEKYHAFDHPYPAALEKIAKFGYDPKQLSHMLRLQEFVVRYIDGVPYGDCLFTEQRDYLLNVKRGAIPLADAQVIREEAKVWFEDFIHNDVQKVPNKGNVEVEKMLEKLTYNLFTDCYRAHDMF